MERLDVLSLDGVDYYINPIIIENAEVTMPADGYCYINKSGYKLLTAQNINSGTYGITRINNRGNDVYNLIMPDYKKGQKTSIQCFWIKG